MNATGITARLGSEDRRLQIIEAGVLIAVDRLNLVDMGSVFARLPTSATLSRHGKEFILSLNRFPHNRRAAECRQHQERQPQAHPHQSTLQEVPSQYSGAPPDGGMRNAPARVGSHVLPVPI
ncbi:hypothetical protein [Roseovarius sp. MBR-78]|uniref:hypothetical protein n=1 Tax=Roseovarius sp. MBR-78 TaxID=3156460 RepID=UPI00339666C2